MLFVHITQLSDVAYSQVFKALRFQPVLAETLLPRNKLRVIITHFQTSKVCIRLANTTNVQRMGKTKAYPKCITQKA